MKQNNATELFTFPVFEFELKKGPQTPTKLFCHIFQYLLGPSLLNKVSSRPHDVRMAPPTMYIRKVSCRHPRPLQDVGLLLSTS